MKPILLFGTHVIGSLLLPAATRADGGLTPEVIDRLRQSYQRDDVRANALEANPIDSLVMNRKV
jgi:hypothetical protein